MPRVLILLSLIFLVNCAHQSTSQRERNEAFDSDKVEIKVGSSIHSDPGEFDSFTHYGGEVIHGTVPFDYNETSIHAEAKRILDDLVVVMKNFPYLRFRLHGHTDSVGSQAFNQRLSEQRAEAVKDYLVQQGIDPDRLETKGFGETDPRLPNDSPELRQHNRRVEFISIQNEE